MLLSELERIQDVPGIVFDDDFKDVQFGQAVYPGEWYRDSVDAFQSHRAGDGFRFCCCGVIGMQWRDIPR